VRASHGVIGLIAHPGAGTRPGLHPVNAAGADRSRHSHGHEFSDLPAAPPGPGEPTLMTLAGPATALNALRSVGGAGDISNAVMWLAFCESRYVTGVALPSTPHSHQVGPGRIAMSNGSFETVAAARPVPRKQPAEIGVLVDRGRVGAGRHADGQRGGVRRTGIHPARGGLPAKRDLATNGAGPARCPFAGDLLADGCSRAPRREVAVAARGEPGTAVGLSSFAASRSRRSWRPTPRPSSRCTGSAAATRWRRGERARAAGRRAIITL